MKCIKRIIVIIAILASFHVMNGQGKMRFNVHADPQFAWYKSSDNDLIKPDGSIFHMQAGLQMDYYFQENYAFVLGFGINNLGGNLLYGDSVSYSNDKGEVPIASGSAAEDEPSVPGYSLRPETENRGAGIRYFLPSAGI